MLFFIPFALASQTTIWSDYRYNNSNDIYTNSVIFDQFGNSFVGGTYFASLYFPNDTLTTYYSGPNNYPDIFITKYDSLGNIKWAINDGGVNDGDYCEDLVSDYNTGDVISVGYYRGDDAFGGLPSSSYMAAYIARYDSTGTLLWSVGGKCPSADVVSRAVDIDPDGFIYVFGEATSSINMSPFYLDSFDYGFFLAKISPQGNPVWLKAFDSSSNRSVADIKYDENGYIYISGAFNHELNFNDTIIYPNLGGYSDFFCAKLDTAGNLIWVNKAGGYTNDYGYSMDIDNEGNSYYYGRFADSIVFENDTTIYGLGDKDQFTAKYNSDGQLVWAKTFIAAGDYEIYYNFSFPRIVLDNTGNMYIAGNFKGVGHIGTDSIVNSATDYDIFLVKLDTSGNPIWISTSYSESDQYCRDISYNNGKIYMTGMAHGTDINIFGDTLTYFPTMNYFVAVLDTTDSSLPTYFENQNKMENIVGIYPNPASNALFVKNASEGTIFIYNLLGILLDEVEVTSDNQMINLSDYKPGTYILRHNEFTEKFFIIK
ncbi:MAG: hypothetical protein A2W91_09900 [Bacteroidetes bacterium GWF2_38_335]|nr:MAG: hypothetical protein A2W91_09900 [Bacteroidetes bacterium GWF2_38_335]